MPSEQVLGGEREAHPPSPRGEAPQRSAAVNGWRGPGAIAIALAHLGIATDALSTRYLFPAALLVDLFFVLSGLVIAQVYATKLAKASNIPEYVIRRVGRIWPVQAATLAILVAYESSKAALEAFGHGHFSSPPFARDGLALLQAIPTNLLLIHSLGLHDHETWNFPSWSVSVEFVTYVAFALFCLLKPALRRAASVATIVASIAILAIVAPLGMRSTFDYGIFRCLAGFFAGTLCFEVATRWPMPRWRHPTAVEIAAIALVLVWLAGAVDSWAGYAAPLVFAMFLLAFIGEGGLISRLLRTLLMQRLADLSFSIYMVHALVLFGLLAAARAMGRAWGWPLFRTIANPLLGDRSNHPTVEVLHVAGLGHAAIIVIVYIAGIALATLAAHALIEVPGRALFNGLASRFSGKFSRRVSGLAPSLPATLGTMERTP